MSFSLSLLNYRVKSKECSDCEKNGAYEILIEKFQEVYPVVARDIVTKKINSLRTVYRKEMVKVNK